MDCVIMRPGNKLNGRILVTLGSKPELYCVEFPDRLPLRFADGTEMERTTDIEEVPTRMGWNVVPFPGFEHGIYVGFMNAYARLAAMHAPEILPRDWSLNPGPGGKREGNNGTAEAQFRIAVRRVSAGHIPTEALEEIRVILARYPLVKREG